MRSNLQNLLTTTSSPSAQEEPGGGVGASRCPAPSHPPPPPPPPLGHIVVALDTSHTSDYAKVGLYKIFSC
jgi:hypothetical protein